MIQLDELEQKAKAATPGQWTADDNIVFCDGESVALDCRHGDASFIASMNPQTALALIRVVRAAQKVCATNFVPLGLLNDLDGALKEIAE